MKLSKRLKAISERCVEFNQPKYIDFNFQKTESYYLINHTLLYHSYIGEIEKL